MKSFSFYKSIKEKYGIFLLYYISVKLNSYSILKEQDEEAYSDIKKLIEGDIMKFQAPLVFAIEKEIDFINNFKNTQKLLLNSIT